MNNPKGLPRRLAAQKAQDINTLLHCETIHLSMCPARAIARLGPRMERFISQENIKRFTEQLKHPANEQQRMMLEQLLDSEEHHLADLERRSYRRHDAQRIAVSRKIPDGPDARAAANQRRMTDTRMRIGAGLLVAVLSLLGIGQSVPATAGAATVSYATR